MKWFVVPNGLNDFVLKFWIFLASAFLCLKKTMRQLLWSHQSVEGACWWSIVLTKRCCKLVLKIINFNYWRIMYCPLTCSNGCRYAVVFDPLDGSSNIDCGVSIGTVWFLSLHAPIFYIFHWNSGIYILSIYFICQNNSILRWKNCLLSFNLDFWDLCAERCTGTYSRWCPATRKEYVGSRLLHVWKLLHGI